MRAEAVIDAIILFLVTAAALAAVVGMVLTTSGETLTYFMLGGAIFFILGLAAYLRRRWFL